MKLNRVSLTLPQEILEKSEKIAKERLEDRSTIMRELLKLGMKQYMINEAINLYVDGKVSLGKTAEIADVSLWKLLDILKDKKIPLRYSQEDIKAEIKRICS